MLTQVANTARDYTHIGMSMFHADLGNGGKVKGNWNELLSTGSYSSLRARTMESERLEKGKSGGKFTLVPTTFAPGNSFYDHADGSEDNERKFQITVYCDDENVELKALGPSD